MTDRIRLHTLNWFDDDNDPQYEIYTSEEERDERLQELIFAQELPNDALKSLEDLDQVWEVYSELEMRDLLGSFWAEGYAYVVDISDAERVEDDEVEQEPELAH